MCEPVSRRKHVESQIISGLRVETLKRTWPHTLRIEKLDAARIVSFGKWKKAHDLARSTFRGLGEIHLQQLLGDRFVEI